MRYFISVVYIQRTKNQAFKDLLLRLLETVWHHSFGLFEKILWKHSFQQPFRTPN